MFIDKTIKMDTSQHWEYVLLYFVAALFTIGCFGDDPITNECGRYAFLPCPGDTDDTEISTGEGTEVDAGDGFDIEVPEGPKMLYLADYAGFENTAGIYGPAGEPVELTAEHPGWKMARCFDCHAVGEPYEPEGHDPTMQYWAWSCARGLPGGACHGHGVNGSFMFNHDRDPAFSNCTQSGCHDTFNASKERENHGIFEADDEYCHACHDFFWVDWPDATTK